MPFPTTFPTSALLRVLEYLRGVGSHSVRDVVEDTYDLLGYGLSVTFQQATIPQMVASASLDTFTDEELAYRLEAIQPSVPAGTQAISVPSWAIPLIMEVIRRLLERATTK